ncbi:6-carboxytetrahydropterin synthase [Alteromonas sp. ASW11-130]|uniref:6-carboxytetrahydropterin synthase n=1 Tax=Alteromonas sp. ASW11-130 TaxID=3015775 RepID=UPI0022421C4D|nr:6-carboxytetrahydropterin synthase [Alteromonas sp. ASW11-130]MCW8092224.1 6-carboxytetrahydropterin synthase [Alteromonas sp. ASW11-130]
MQLFVNDLTVMDFSYLCHERGMVGESWIVDVILDGDLNEESMVQDFSIVKKNLKRLIDEYVDHKLLVPAEHTATTVINSGDESEVEVRFQSADKHQIMLRCPAEAYAFIYSDAVTKVSVGDYLKEIIATHLPDNVDNITLNLRTEVIDVPYYHYTHGLKKHDGNCQRIAHGHRSRVDLFINDLMCSASQQYWARRWADIYIATEEDVIDFAERKITGEIDNEIDYWCFGYESSQGYFELIMPKSRCEVITTDSTVECLAQFMYEQQKQRLPGNKVKVIAYEGVGKGAMVSD